MRSKYILNLALTVFVFASSARTMDIEPVELIKCWSTLRKISRVQPSLVPSSFQKIHEGNKISTSVVTKIGPHSINQLFDFQPAQEAQSKAFGLAYRGLDGRLSTLFWSKGKPDSPSFVSHREAIQQLLRSERDAIHIFLLKNPNSHAKQLLTEMKENLSHLLVEMDNNPKIPPAIAERFFPLIVEANKKEDHPRLSIAQIDIDPSILGGFSFSNSIVQIEETQAIIDFLARNQDSDFKPSRYRIPHSVLNSYLGPRALKAPAGSKIESLNQ